MLTKSIMASYYKDYYERCVRAAAIYRKSDCAADQRKADMFAAEATTARQKLDAMGVK